jgi:hypothetical protein
MEREPTLTKRSVVPLPVGDGEGADEFLLLSGSTTWKPSRIRGPRSTRSLIAVVTAASLVILLAIVGVAEWRRALNDERQLTAAHGRITAQVNTITGLNTQVAELNNRIDVLSGDLSEAQDEAAVNGAKADRFSNALSELAMADDLMHDAVRSIGLMMSALADGNYYQASFYAQQSRSQIDAASQHEANALAALRE